MGRCKLPNRWLSWLMLLLFVAISIGNAACAFTFSAMPAEAGREFSFLDSDEVQMLAIYSSIIPAVTMSASMWLLSRPNGLRDSMIIGAGLLAAGTGTRYLPTVLAPHSEAAAKYGIHAGQILNAFSITLFMASPPVISLQMFPAKLSATVTALACTAYQLGATLAFFLPVYVTDDLHAILAASFALSLLLLGSTLTLLLPCCAGEIETMHRKLFQRNGAAAARGGGGVCGELKQALQTPSFMLFAVILGAVSGAWFGWCPLLPTALQNSRISPVDADNAAFAANAGTIAGSVLIGFIADRCFRGKIQLLIALCLLLCLLPLLLLLLALPVPFDLPNWLSFMQDATPRTLSALAAASGVFQGGILPLAYEFCARIVFPVGAGTAGGILQVLVNSMQFFFFFVPLLLSGEWLNAVMFMLTLQSLICSCIVPTSLKRQDSAAQAYEAIEFENDIEFDHELAAQYLA